MNPIEAKRLIDDLRNAQEKCINTAIETRLAITYSQKADSDCDLLLQRIHDILDTPTPHAINSTSEFPADPFHPYSPYSKIRLIKCIRTATNLGLKEAKDIADAWQMNEIDFTQRKNNPVEF
jgi:hypothetical protein